MLNCHFLQIPLGVLLKTETKYEDMVGIMDHLHQYVPIQSLQSTSTKMRNQVHRTKFPEITSTICSLVSI